MTGKQFIWGAAISAAQTESSLGEGRGPSIWDDFCNRKRGWIFKKSPIRNNHHIRQSADFIHHYKTDIDLLSKIGFKHFRFSISWPFLMPDGVNTNEHGIKFYQELIDYCHESEITPWVTLYHWDLPQALENKGGWTNREIVQWFGDYAEFCVKTFKSVKNWMILNEPSVFLGAGYLFGIHAPGRRGFETFFKATHHAMLSIRTAFDRMKAVDASLNIGSTFSFTDIEPLTSKDKDIKASRIADLLINRFFFEPVIGLGYPFSEDVRKLEQIRKYMKPGDEELLHTPLDFIGVQTYTREVFKHNPFNPYLRIRHVPAVDRSIDLSAMNWEMNPESIYRVLMKVHRYKLEIPILVTENGVAFEDRPVLDRINDFPRIHYYQTHINEVMRAREEGAKVEGYFAWSLIDNFEWAEGYHPRFGLIYVDFETKQRTLKESARWFRHFLSARD